MGSLTAKSGTGRQRGRRRVGQHWKPWGSTRADGRPEKSGRALRNRSIAHGNTTDVGGSSAGMRLRIR